jgi:hypothetical protein
MRKIMLVILLVTLSLPKRFLVNSTVMFYDNGKVIILNDSKQEEEVHEEATANTDVVPSATARRPSTPTASPTDTNEDPGAAPNDSSDGLAPGPKMGRTAMAERKPARLRLPRQERHLQQACFKESYV